MNGAPGPLFVPPGAGDGLPWAAILPMVIAIPAIALLVIGLGGRRRLPAALGAAALILPISAYAFASLYVMEGSKEVSFCGSCHVMTPIVAALESDKESLASIHVRRGLVPHDEACYTCHSGYGIWGTMDAKMAGVMHMVRTLTGNYKLPIELHGTFDINSCLNCHATSQAFRDVKEHQDPEVQKALPSHDMSCTGVCHPEAHPASALTGGVDAAAGGVAAK